MREGEVQATTKETAVQTELVKCRNGHVAKQPVVEDKGCKRLNISMHHAVEQHVTLLTHDSTDAFDRPADWQVSNVTRQ